MKRGRDYGSSGVRVAYEYGYNSDGVRVWKRDVLNGQEYRYVCRIGCGGVPMRVYNRPMSGGSWASVEDYLPAGNALGYNENWQYRHSGGKFLMMTASGEPSAYYPMDSNGLAVQNTPAQPCVCPVAPVQTAPCSPLGYGGCEGKPCTEEPPVLPPWVYPRAPGGFPIYGNWCGPKHPDPRIRQIGDCQRGGIPDYPPVWDDVDACCCKHDQCYEQYNCNDTLCSWMSCDCAICDGLLANCVLLIPLWRCITPECALARASILLYMGTAAWRCLLSLIPASAPPPSPTPPIRLPGPTGPCGGQPCP